MEFVHESTAASARPHSPIRDANNHTAAIVYAIAVAGLAAVCILLHVLNRLATRWIPKSTALGRGLTAVNNVTRCIFSSKTLRVVNGRLVLIVVYLGVNVTLALLELDFAEISHVARRLGWLSLLNLSLTVLLALKLTPLSPLLHQSHQTLWPLHRVTGVTAILLILSHGPLFTVSLANRNRLHILTNSTKIGAALIAALALLLILATAVRFVRKGQYEFFKAIHVVLVATVLGMVGCHVYDVRSREPFYKQIPFMIVLCTGGLWVLDRGVRGLRWCTALIGSHATITALPGGATRVEFNRMPFSFFSCARNKTTKPSHVGAHYFLWIPALRFLEAHPFTLVRSDPHPVFVIAAKEGFTKLLYERALAHPNGLKLRAAMEGPYTSSVASTADVDKVVLVAGGSGASFTVALALEWARTYRLLNSSDRLSGGDRTQILHTSRGRHMLEKNRGLEFVWSVKRRECLSWFHEELVELQECEGVSLSLHITSPATASSAAERNSHRDGSGKLVWPFDAIEENMGAEDEDEDEVDEKDWEKEKNRAEWEWQQRFQAARYSGPPTIRVVSGKVIELPREKALMPLPPLVEEELARKEASAMVEEVRDEQSQGDDEEKGTTHPSSDLFWNMLKLSKSVMKGRPNVDDTLYAAAEHLWRGKRVLVAACGPRGLLEDTRTAVVSRMKWDLPEVQLHLERFGA